MPAKACLRTWNDEDLLSVGSRATPRAATWREFMPQVRAEAIRLVETGKLRCTQRGHEVDPTKARGPLRFSAPIRDVG
jgi:hypothetical protein